MKTLGCVLLAVLLVGCLPIGIRGSSAPLRGADVRERPIIAAMDRRVAAE